MKIPGQRSSSGTVRSARGGQAAMLLLSVVAMLAGVMTSAQVGAQPPVGGGGGYTSYPDLNLNSGITGQEANGNIPRSGSPWSSLADVASTFAQARSVENADLCSDGSCEAGAQIMPTAIVFPADYAGWSTSEKGLWLLNEERKARGLLPFEGVDPFVEQVAQNWAQTNMDDDSFVHNPDIVGDVEALCTGCVGNIGNGAAENLYWRWGSPTLGEPEFGIEIAIYWWMYEDFASSWGHRHALLWDNLENDHGPADSEGFVGFGLINAPYTYPGGPPGIGDMIVFNAIDTNSAYPVSPPPGYVPLAAPCPIYDSTTATGDVAGTFDGGVSRTVSVTGLLPASQGVGSGSCVPDGAVVGGVVMTITAKAPQAEGNLRIAPAGVVPTGGVVNYANNGLDNTNTVTVGVSVDGDVTVTANGGTAGQGQPSTDVRIAVLGYFGAGGDGYTSVTPCAVADSRSTQGASDSFLGPFDAGAVIPDIDVVGTFSAAQGGGNGAAGCGVPATASAVLANLVALNPVGSPGALSAGTGGTDPSEPSVAFAPLSMNNAAVVVVPLDGQDSVAIDIDGPPGARANMRLVVLGYFSPTSAAVFTSVDPCAIFDTRSDQGADGVLSGARDGGSTTTYQITGASVPVGQGGGHGGGCDVPAGATAVLINLVAINSTTEGNLRGYGPGTTPGGGVLNFADLDPKMNNSNAVVVPLSAGGELSVDVNTGGADVAGATDIRGVIYGYFSLPTPQL